MAGTKPDLSLLEGTVAKSVLDAMRAASAALTRVGVRHTGSAEDARAICAQRELAGKVLPVPPARAGRRTTVRVNRPRE